MKRINCIICLIGLSVFNLFIIRAYCEGITKAPQPILVEFRFVCEKASANCEKMVSEDRQEELLLEKQPQLTIDDLQSAEPRYDAGTLPSKKDNRKSLILKNEPEPEAELYSSIYLKFNEEGGKKLSKFTSENIGKRLGIIIDGKLIMAPRILEPIPNGEVVVSGRFTKTYTVDISRQINRAIKIKQ